MTNAMVERVDWHGARAEVTDHLRNLIQLETVNPPGNETKVASYLRAAVEPEGLTATILEGSDGRGNFVTRIRGSGNGRPLLLMAHADVVSVEADKWQHPPFAATVEDGMIWGRGAVDTKNLVASELMVMLLVSRLGLTLDRDLIMCTFADEEAGGRFGADWMWENHRDLIDADVAINEGGGHAMEVMGRRFYMCQTGEKGAARMRVIARADPGHASVPRDDTAMLRMGRALIKLTEHQFPTIMTASVERMLLSIGESIGGDMTGTISDILSEPTWENLNRLPIGDFEKLSLRATTRNTAVPTIIHGGHRINVIPGEVVCDVDGRVLPGQDPADFVRQVQDMLGPDVIVEPTRGSTGIEADPDSPLFDTIRSVMQDVDPGSDVAPFLVSGGTDAKSLPGVKVYGFNPGRVSTVEMTGAHNHDERVSIDNVEYATRCLFDIVTRYCSAR
ncbi:MAG TPA: M20/M25/M40 family metallo-hydrolase [Thermomicrobiales bacterium]|nr:M20/M25/M40 family metallo-hydrolase [Thermomicrobiales bacterium]